MKDYDNFQILENTHFDVDDIDDVLEHCTTHRLSRRKNILYSEDVLAFDIETSSFTMSDDSSVFDDTAVYYHIKGLTLKIDEHIESDIQDLKLYKQKFFGLLFLSRESGYPVDSLYKELNELYPYYFPDDIYHVSDQLLKIFEILALVKPKAEGDSDKVSLMYVWQLAINGRVVIGRTWSDFIYVINKIEAFYRTHKDRRVIIYVHNLSFEMQHIFKLFAWSKVFAIAPRKPIYAITETGIEFRCSYLLSNYSLAVVGENLQKYKVKKLTGQLDYRQIRTPNTMLTDDELNYCINDVLVVSAYIKECIEADGSITKIPYTATGYCRNYCRFNCLSGKGRKNQLEQFKKYHKLMMGLTVDADEFEQLQRAFMGGFTHCSARYSMKTMHNCDSFDFTSSYPAVLLSEGLPMSKAQEVTISSREDLDMYIKLYCCLFDVKFTGLAPKTINENYIPLSKCWSRSNIISNNGRVVSADEIYITITDVDFRIIEQNYVWKDMKVGKFRIYKRGYLPKELILSILSLYKDKTELKGVEGKEVEYLKSKGLLNSIYGMMVTNPIRPVIELIDGVWCVNTPDMQKSIDKYNNSKKRFLFYPWGVWCTAYARYNLWTGIRAFGDDYIYSDTDSIKCINADKHMDYINEYNNEITGKLLTMCKHYDLDPALLAPKTIKGVAKPIGIWDHETADHKYLSFKSIGAKRYMILTDEGLTMTVSGVNKHIAAPYLVNRYGIDKVFDMFDEGLEIPADYTGKLTHYYIDDSKQGIIEDYQGVPFEFDESDAPSGVYLEAASYDFSMSADYINYLATIRGERIEIL